MDDPLSAVDAKVSEHIFDQCICNLLQDKIILLATYEEKHMEAASQVVVLHNGSVLGKGTFQELKEGSKILDSIAGTSGNTSKENPNATESESDKIIHSYSTPVIENYNDVLEISEEDKAIGNISFSMYWDYFIAGIHPVALIAVALYFLVSQGECKATSGQNIMIC